MQINSLTIRNQRSIYFIVLVAALSGLLFGFNTGVISGAILFINREFQITTFYTSLIVSSALFGAFVSSIISGMVVDYYGRRQLMMINAALFCCGALGSALAADVQWLIVSRFFVGFAVGVSSYVAPLYISELAPFRRRGVLVGFNQLFIVIGLLISYAVDYGFAFGGHWRLMFGVGAIPALLLMVGMFFVPESPRWLVANNRNREARDILLSVRVSANIEYELLEIKESVEEQRGDWRMLLQPWLLPAAIVGFGMAALQQLVGINIFLYYGPMIFAFAGIAQENVAMLATFGIGLLLVVFTMIGLPLIDGWGRRPLLLLGSVGMTLGLLILGAIFWFIPVSSALLMWLVLIGSIVYIASFAISFGPIGWLIISEMFPLRIRGLAMSLATATIWGFNMLVVFTFLPLIRLLRPSGIFLLYSGLCALSLLFVYFLVPETKKTTLEHIETNLRSGRPSRELGE